MDIPYCFVKGKARLGQLVHQKNAAVVALTEVRKEDEGDLNNLTSAFRTNFNENAKLRKQIGGFKKGAKSQIKFDKVQAIKEKEIIQLNDITRLEKHGFEREGLMRKNVHINGQWEDHYHYALINPNDL